MDIIAANTNAPVHTSFGRSLLESLEVVVEVAERAVSMSPLETAKASNAPLLENADSKADVKALMTLVGQRSVRYGAVSINAPGATYAAGKEGI
jgi:hypothetical protein